MVTDQEHLALFYDNGVLPEGNALFPREPVPIDGYEALIKTGRAAFIEAFYRESLELISGLSLPHSVWLNAEMTGDWWMFKYAIQESVGLWAHFGTYGGRDEIWVVAKKEHAGRRREGTPMGASECQGQGSANETRIKGHGPRQNWLRGLLRRALHDMEEIDKEVFGTDFHKVQGQGSGKHKRGGQNCS